MPKRKPKLIVVAGCAASGKSTIARILARLMGATYIDKDDATRRLTDLALTLGGHEPTDRESDFYVDRIRDLEYDTMFAIANANLDIGNDVVVSAPFLNVIKDYDAWNTLRYPIACDSFDVDIIWIEHDAKAEHARMIARAATRDGNKLSDWGKYEQSVENIEPDDRYDALRFENADGSSPDDVAWDIYRAVIR